MVARIGAPWTAPHCGGAVTRKRSYLFLQGVCSPFFARLGEALRAEGHRVHKVNFNVGDALYWRIGGAYDFRSSIDGLPKFLNNLYAKLEITDQLLFGDRRPAHIVAREAGRSRKIRTHVFEEGYFRPFWVTLEQDGVNGHSHLPRTANWYRAVGPSVPDYGEGEAFRTSFTDRALHDVSYHAAGFWNPILFPHYKNHAPTNAAVEYAGYVQRLPKLRLIERHDADVVANLLQRAAAFFFFPLQLGSDAQILDHSRFSNMRQVIELVMSSFAQNVPDDTRLVIKNHPLDTGQCNYQRMVGSLARQLGVANRVDYIESGDLNSLLMHARGVVTVNSTTGLVSLGFGCPTFSLGTPIYQLPGLTCQGRLEDFWRAPTLPDMNLFRLFRNTVIHTTQINGGFYSREGIDLAVRNSVGALVAERSALESLL